MGTPRVISRLTFWLGGLAAIAVGPPLISVALGILARKSGLGDPHAAEDTRLFVALGYAGLPAFVTGGGVARLVAHRRYEEGSGARLWRDIARGAGAMALAGIGLAVLTAVPLGGLPIEAARWAPLLLVGIACGVPAGLAVAALASVRQRVYAGRPADVEPVAEKRVVVDPTATDQVPALPPPDKPAEATPEPGSLSGLSGVSLVSGVSEAIAPKAAAAAVAAVGAEVTPPPNTEVDVVPERDWSRPMPDTATLELEKTTRRPVPSRGEVIVPKSKSPKKKGRRKGKR